MKLTRTFLSLALSGIIVAVLIMLISMSKCSGEIITVDDDGGQDYDTIQYAIQNATDGDTIRVFDGRYHENLYIPEKLTLLGNGSDSTFLIGDGAGNVVYIDEDHITISGFSISGGGSGAFDAAIYTEYRDHLTITENVLSGNNNSGIVLRWSRNSTVISNNIIRDNGDYGIFLETSGNNYISNNTIQENYHGIRIDWSNKNVLENNTCTGNTRGIDLYDSSWSVIVDNNCSNNSDYGIVIRPGVPGEEDRDSRGTQVARNTLNGNTAGLIVFSGYGNNATENICSGNEYGFYLMDGTSTTLHNNTLSGNEYSLVLDNFTNVLSIGGIIQDSIVIDLYFNATSDLTTIDSLFDNDSVYFNDDGSSLTVQWNIDLEIEDTEGESVAGALIDIRDQADHHLLLEYAEVSGHLNGIILLEYTENSQGKQYRNEYNITANDNVSRGWAGDQVFVSGHGRIMIILDHHLDPIEYIRIEDADGEPVDNPVYNIGDNYDFYAVGINSDSGFVRYVEAHWSSSNTTVGTVQYGPSINTEFEARLPVKCQIEAVYDAFAATTGDILVDWKVWNVNKGQFYERIGDGIREADDNDTLLLGPHNFYESIEIDKMISIMGHESLRKPLISANSEGSVILVQHADNVRLSHLMIAESGTGQDDSGISLLTDFVSIRDCDIQNNQQGITIIGSHDVIISGCNVSDNEISGLRLLDCSSTDICSNSITGNTYGIFFRDSVNNTITNNTIKDNAYGVYLESASHSNIARCNIIMGNRFYGIHAENNDGFVLNATRNWWNDETGPFHPDLNPDGNGDEVSDNVYFFPWVLCLEARILSNLPGILTEGEKIDLRGCGYSCDAITTYEWHSDRDGLLYHGKETWFSISNLSNGTHTISFRVRDDTGNWSMEVNMSITINGIPRARIRTDLPFLVVEGDITFFFAEASDDRSIVRYVWESSIDGIFYDGISGGFNHSLQSNGTHEISLSVQDDNGIWSLQSNTTIHRNGRPRIRAISPIPESINEGRSVYLVANSTDDNIIVLHRWISDLDGELHNGSDPGFSRNLSAGIHRISVQAMDEFGTWSQEVVVILKVIPVGDAYILPEEIMLAGSMIGGEVQVIRAIVRNGCDRDLTLMVNWFIDDLENLYHSTLITVEAWSLESLSLNWTPERTGRYTIRVLVITTLVAEQDPTNNQAMTVVEINDRGDNDSRSFFMLMVGTFMVIGCAVVAMTAGSITDRGKYRLWLLSIPLYSRIRKNQAEDSESRSHIMSFIRQYPGATYGAIKRELDYSNGRLTYHLSVLERTQKLKSRNDGFNKKFYPRDYVIPCNNGDTVSFIRSDILDVLAKHNELDQKQIGMYLNKDRRTISYHLKKLTGSGQVTVRKRGKKKYYRIPDT